MYDAGTVRFHRADASEPADSLQPAPAKGAVPAAEAAALKSVLEYRGFAGVLGEPAEFPNLAKPAQISKPDGSFHADVLSATSTRYRWALRNQAAKNGTPDAELQQRYDAMLAHSHNGVDRPDFCRHSRAALRVAPFKLYR